MARTYRGTAGNDTITGALNDQDLFIGFGQGYDNLTGGNRNDTFKLTVDEHRDHVDGGNGVDTVDYSGADRGLAINLYTGITTAQFFYESRPVPGGNGLVSGMEEKIVTDLRNIENVVGSNYDDYIVGNARNNVLEGGGGNDYINGGDGRDTVSFAHSTQGVKVDLSGLSGNGEGRAYSQDGSVDRLISIENVIGSDHNDRIQGSQADNVLTGGNGSDTFVFKGWFGHDTITDFHAGGQNHDVLEFGGFFENFADLRSHAENHGNDVVIHIDEFNSVTLEGVHLNNLHESDFHFV